MFTWRLIKYGHTTITLSHNLVSFQVNAKFKLILSKILVDLLQQSGIDSVAEQRTPHEAQNYTISWARYQNEAPRK